MRIVLIGFWLLATLGVSALMSIYHVPPRDAPAGFFYWEYGYAAYVVFAFASCALIFGVVALCIGGLVKWLETLGYVR
jgi:hypothetical protein